MYIALLVAMQCYPWPASPTQVRVRQASTCKIVRSRNNSSFTWHRRLSVIRSCEAQVLGPLKERQLRSWVSLRTRCSHFESGQQRARERSLRVSARWYRNETESSREDSASFSSACKCAAQQLLKPPAHLFSQVVVDGRFSLSLGTVQLMYAAGALAAVAFAVVYATVCRAALQKGRRWRRVAAAVPAWAALVASTYSARRSKVLFSA